MKKWLLHNWLPRSVCLLIIGAILGIFFSQFSYFKMNKEVSLSDLFVFAATALVTIYVASTITKSLSSINSLKALYQEEIKEFLKYSAQLENWILSEQVKFADLVPHLKMGNIKLRAIDRLYKNTKQISQQDLNPIVDKYNDLKADITAISPAAGTGTIMLDSVHVSNFLKTYEDIKFDLFQVIANS